MKNIRSLSLIVIGGAVLIFGCAHQALSQSQSAGQGRTHAKGSPASSHAKDPIQTIREQYATINKNAASYKTVKRELTGFSTEGGEIIAYFDGPKIMKIVASHFGESGKAVEEFYYWDDKLIFVYRKDSFYDRHLSGKVARTTESRFYFSNDRLIRWIGENRKQVAPGNSGYQEKEKSYLQISREFTEGARSQKPVIESAQ